MQSLLVRENKSLFIPSSLIIFTEELHIIRYSNGKRNHIRSDKVTTFSEELYLVNFLLVSKMNFYFPLLRSSFANIFYFNARIATEFRIFLWNNSRSLTVIAFDGHVYSLKLIPSSVFVSFSLACATELPAGLLLALVLDRWGRRFCGFITLALTCLFSFSELLLQSSESHIHIYSFLRIW